MFRLEIKHLSALVCYSARQGGARDGDGPGGDGGVRGGAGGDGDVVAGLPCDGGDGGERRLLQQLLQRRQLKMQQK